MFWSVVIAVVIVVLLASWWSDYRRRGTTNPFGARKNPQDDAAVNEARFVERSNDLFNGGGSI